MSLERQRLELGGELRDTGHALRRTAGRAYTAGLLSEHEARKVVRASTALEEIANKIVVDTTPEAA